MGERTTCFAFQLSQMKTDFIHMRQSDRYYVVWGGPKCWTRLSHGACSQRHDLYLWHAKRKQKRE